MKGEEMVKFGAYFKELRLKTGLTLREFCQKHGLDPGNLSRLERGLVPPPQGREKLGSYAEFLGLKKGSDEWYQFFDLASTEAGRIPEDVLSDEAVVAKLPLLFRTLRGQKVPEDKLNELIRQIRGR
jgi:transcriptional regulator with XRE-family HTH domain